MRLIRLLCIAMVIMACKKKDEPSQPTKAQLVFPDKNSECTTGKEISATTTEVEFKWQAATHTDSYELRVTNIDVNSTQTISTKSLSAKLPLQKGAFYSWSVNTRNGAVLQVTTSETWQFYNAGFATSHPPFSTELLQPESGQSVNKDINNEVLLRWQGADIDNDIESYEVLLDTADPPVTILATLGQSATSTKTSVVANTVYYWKVVTKDKSGNSAASAVYSFRAL